MMEQGVTCCLVSSGLQTLTLTSDVLSNTHTGAHLVTQPSRQSTPGEDDGDLLDVLLRGHTAVPRVVTRAPTLGHGHVTGRHLSVAHIRRKLKSDNFLDWLTIVT